MRTKMIYTLLWWPSWYLLFFMHGAQGELQWVVTEKVSIYGQSLTLFCPVDNCCIEKAGWSNESKAIFIDIKIYPDDPNLKYGRTYNESGFGLIIRNLSETDVNKTYECVYGFQKSTHQYLLQEDVFKKDDPSTDEENSTTDGPSTDEENSTTDGPSTDEGDNTTKMLSKDDMYITSLSSLAKEFNIKSIESKNNDFVKDIYLLIGANIAEMKSVLGIIVPVLIISIGIFIYLYRRKQCTKQSDANNSVHYGADQQQGLLSSTSASGGETLIEIEETPPDRQNTKPITVRVMKKTLFEYGKKVKMKRIEMLLCDSNNCIEAFAKGDTWSTKVDKTLEKDKVYKISNYKIDDITDSFMRIEFIDLTQFIVSDDETISYNNLVAKINISEVRDRCRAKEHISLHPVIITSIGPTRQPLIKFLKEIMLKDDSGKVIMQIWSKENDIDFQFSRGDVVDLFNVIVGKLNANSPRPEFSVIYNKDNSEIISSPLEARKEMERLLEHEDPDELKPIEMTVQKLSRLKVEKHLVIVTAGIENFAKNEKQTFIVMNCDEVVTHGYLEQQGEKWYCKECGEYRIGKRNLELKATIADNSKVTVGIILYDKACKVVLEKTYYDEFLTSDRNKQIQILKAVQRQHIDYTFEINHAEYNHVKKASGGKTLIDETPPDDQHDESQNTNPITVKVMKKTLLKDGKRITKKRIEMLLCDRINCIGAFAKGDTSTSVDKTLEKDKVYKISNYKIENSTDSFKRIEFTDVTQFIVSEDETISYNNLVAKINISEVRDRCRAKEHISLHPVIIASIGPTRQPLNKFLKEIMLKDDSGKVIMQIWSKENDIDFQFSRGDVVDLYNVIIGKLNANSPKPEFSVIYNKDNSEIISSPLEARKRMERLLEHEDPDELKPIEMTVQKLSSLKVEKHLVIVTAGIENFAKNENQTFIVMNCDEVVTHGYLKKEKEKWNCKECGEYRDGKQMLELKATISDNSNVTVGIILYNKACKLVLGKTYYDEFLTSDRNKQIQILKAVQRQHIDYTFEINHAEFNHVKKVYEKQN